MNAPTGSVGDAVAQPQQHTSASGRCVDASNEAVLIERLRNRDEASFLEIVQRHHASLVRLAQSFVNSRDVAEEVAQETWVGVLHGIDRFEGRSSLKTWIFQILVNRAKTRGQREGRMIPFSSAWDSTCDLGEPAVDPSQFNENDPEWPGGWVTQPRNWAVTPEQSLLSREFRAHAEAAIDSLPPSQREVITLRDVQGFTSEEVCNLLNITETNQRVLLHRARSKVRQALDRYLDAH